MCRLIVCPVIAFESKATPQNGSAQPLIKKTTNLKVLFSRLVSAAEQKALLLAFISPNSD